MWETQTVVVIMKLNRAFAISVLWVQLKAVYSTSWCCIVLIRERNQKLIILIYTSMIDQLKVLQLASLCTQPAGWQNRNFISIILTFSWVMYFFMTKFYFQSLPLYIDGLFPVHGKSSNLHDCYFYGQ